MPLVYCKKPASRYHALGFTFLEPKLAPTLMVPQKNKLFSKNLYKLILKRFKIKF